MLDSDGAQKLVDTFFQSGLLIVLSNACWSAMAYGTRLT